jgi:hypothetical protein
MEIVKQSLEDLLAGLGPLAVDWRDETALRVIERLRALPAKGTYDKEDVQTLLDEEFEDGILICRLFLGVSKDQFVSLLREVRGAKGIGVKSYRTDPAAFLDDLVSAGVLESMANEAARKPHWTDVVVERLRSGRGSAIAGQRRGREVEDFAEETVRKVFGEAFQARCSFAGPRGQVAKCDFAIPSASAARILIEAKGYGATGSKMTDILGDLHTIIARKRPDTALLFFTDGLTWKQRQSDLRKIIELQNNGDITRIYTSSMADRFEADLRRLKREYEL